MHHHNQLENKLHIYPWEMPCILYMYQEILFSLNHGDQFENQTSYPWEVPHMCVVQQKSKNPYCYAPPINQKK